jgi:hypothetical protein
LFIAGLAVAGLSQYILLHDGGSAGRCAQFAIFALPAGADYIDSSLKGSFEIFPLQVRCVIEFTDGSTGVDLITDWLGTWLAYGLIAAGVAVVVAVSLRDRPSRSGGTRT